jgi:hypothetical protein
MAYLLLGALFRKHSARHLIRKIIRQGNERALFSFAYIGFSVSSIIIIIIIDVFATGAVSLNDIYKHQPKSLNIVPSQS